MSKKPVSGVPWRLVETTQCVRFTAAGNVWYCLADRYLSSRFDIDFLSLTYTRNSADVRAARQALQQCGLLETKIIAKVALDYWNCVQRLCWHWRPPDDHLPWIC